MKRVLTAVLCALLLASCAATRPLDPAYNPGHSTNAEYMAANANVPTGPLAPEPDPLTKALTKSPMPAREAHEARMNPAEIAHANALIQRGPTPPSTGVSGWDVLGAIVAIPLLLPIAMIANYPSYRSTSTHCYSYTYKDQYHVKCY